MHTTGRAASTNIRTRVFSPRWVDSRPVYLQVPVRGRLKCAGLEDLSQLSGLCPTIESGKPCSLTAEKSAEGILFSTLVRCQHTLGSFRVRA